MRTLQHSAILLLILFAVAGCDYGQPAYVEPSGPPASNAILTGSFGTFVMTVDNTPVSGTGLQVTGLGWNTVTVSPGVHDLAVSGSLDNGNAANNTRSHYFLFDCQAGHTYKFSPASKWRPYVLRVTDQSTKQTLEIDDVHPRGE